VDRALRYDRRRAPQQPAAAVDPMRFFGDRAPEPPASAPATEQAPPPKPEDPEKRWRSRRRELRALSHRQLLAVAEGAERREAQVRSLCDTLQKTANEHRKARDEARAETERVRTLLEQERMTLEVVDEQARAWRKRALELVAKLRASPPLKGILPLILGTAMLGPLMWAAFRSGGRS
jgi:hypothetical protein